MKKSLLLALALGSLLLTACNLGYGPVQDHSEFISARLAGDQRTVVFSVHHFAYRPATGWRAFPDGGVPDYLTDSNVLGTYDLQTGAVNIIRHEQNGEWQPGSGNFFVIATQGNKALISQGGQLLGPFRHGVKYLLLDFVSNDLEVLDLKGDLAARQRDTGYLYLVDSVGTLVFVTLSLEEAQDPSAYRKGKSIPEIWVRTPSGEYLKVAASNHYKEVRQGEVIYWEPATRAFKAFSLASRTTRTAAEFRDPGYVDVVTGISLSSDRKGLAFGRKVADQWHYQPLDLTLDELK